MSNHTPMPMTSPSPEAKRHITEAVLLIDDDPLVLKSLKLTLAREGYILYTAQSGEEAVTLMSEHPIALVICDIWLPGMGGIEVLQQAQRLRPNAVRIALTAHSDLQTVLKTINIGHVSQFIVKPWDELFSFRQWPLHLNDIV